jgi:hypothetical protein
MDVQLPVIFVCMWPSLLSVKITSSSEFLNYYVIEKKVSCLLNFTFSSLYNMTSSIDLGFRLETDNFSAR